jgi:hypothetical protein
MPDCGRILRSYDASPQRSGSLPLGLRAAAWIRSRPRWLVRQVRFSTSLMPCTTSQAHGWRILNALIRSELSGWLGEANPSRRWHSRNRHVAAHQYALFEHCSSVGNWTLELNGVCQSWSSVIRLEAFPRSGRRRCFKNSAAKLPSATTMPIERVNSRSEHTIRRSNKTILTWSAGGLCSRTATN